MSFHLFLVPNQLCGIYLLYLSILFTQFTTFPQYETKYKFELISKVLELCTLALYVTLLYWI